MWNRLWHRWSTGFAEAGGCIGAAIRDVRHEGLGWRSALLCIAATSLWLWLYYHFGAFFLKLSGLVALFSFSGLMAVSGVHFGAKGGSVVSMGNMGSGMVDFAKGLGPVVQMAMMALAIAAFFYALLWIVATLTTIQLPLRWTLLPRSKVVAAGRYVAWQPPGLAPLPRRSSGERVRAALKVVLMLCIPVWALLVVVRFLMEANVRLLYPVTAEGVLKPDQRRALAQAQQPAILALGILLTLLMLLPVFNLFVPAVLCSSVSHLQRRGWIYTPRPLEPHALPLVEPAS